MGTETRIQHMKTEKLEAICCARELEVKENQKG